MAKVRKQMPRNSRALALALSVSLLLMSFAAAAQPFPATFWGVVPQGARPSNSGRA